MRFGNYECSALDLGDFWVDGGAMFGIIPKVEWQEKTLVDPLNRIRLANRSLLIQGNGRNILVDTGCGFKLSKEMKEQYGIEHQPVDFNLMLSGFDLDVHQISDVILTHLHFDHAGGSTMAVGSRIDPLFPNARYHVQTEQWEYARNPHERDKDSYLEDDFLPLQQQGVLELIDGSLTLFDGIELMVTYGHTPGMHHVIVKGEEKSLFFCGDLVPTVNHLPVPWMAGYDNKPMEMYPEKDYFLRKAIRENWLLFFQHDPQIVVADVKEGAKWIEFDREVNI